MIRTVRHWLVGVLFGATAAGGGVASAQSPVSPAALAGGAPPPVGVKAAPVETPARAQAPAAADAEVLVMRTAGQPERKIRVLKVVQTADGQSMADVQDVESGQKFTVPAKIVAALKRGATAGTPPQPTTPPVTQAPATLPAATLPPQGAKPYPIAPQPVQQAAAVQPVPPPQQPAVRQAIAYQPITPKPEPRAAVAPPAAPASTSASAWRSVNDPQPVTPQPTPTAPTGKRDLWNAVGTPQPTAPTTPATPRPVPSATTPGFAPPLPTAGTVTRGQAPEPTYGYRRLQFRPASNWEPPARGFPATSPDVPRVREEREPITPVGFVYPARPSLEQQLLDDTKQAVFDLYMAVRPSLREEAASVLAGGRFASRPEVKQVLAKAAVADPAAGVRAHCIGLLAELGYHDPEYVVYLQECSATGNPSVQAAATAALAKLAPKR